MTTFGFHHDHDGVLLEPGICVSPEILPQAASHEVCFHKPVYTTEKDSDRCLIHYAQPSNCPKCFPRTTEEGS